MDGVAFELALKGGAQSYVRYLGLLSLDTVNIPGCITVCGVGVGVCPVHCRTLSNIASLESVH